MGAEKQNLTAEDQLFILMQAGLYLTATRGMGAPEARICYERAEPLCNSLNRPQLLYGALMGQWRYSLMTSSRQRWRLRNEFTRWRKSRTNLR